MRLDGARVLVTGGCGFVGSTTVDELLRRGVAGVVILDNLVRGSLDNVRTALTDPRAAFVHGDVRDRAQVARAIQGVDAVIHLAALRITACAADPREAFSVMCDGSFNVVEAARDAHVKKIAAASSASIYGMAETFPTGESHHPYNNRTWYGAAKLMLEGLLRAFNDVHGLSYVGLRYFNVYGPRMDIHGKYTEVLVRWMERLDAGLPPLIFGDGTETMDLVYVDDVARATVLALESAVDDEVFNVGSGHETSLDELATLLARVMNVAVAPEYRPPRSVNPVPRRLADTSNAADRLGFRAAVPLEDGLRRLVDWWRVARVAA